MGERPEEHLPPWRETPLDHWSTDIDPTLMAGDEWAAEENTEDPGAERMAEEHGGTVMDSPFMHPTHDTNFGIESDVFRSELPE